MPHQIFKTLFFSCIILSYGCATTIPAVDNTAPTFRLEIQGGLPDGPAVYTSGEDYSRTQLNLKNNTNYRFILTVQDPGGVRSTYIRMMWPIQYQNVHPSVETYTSEDELFEFLEWRGDFQNPKNAVIISGSLYTRMYNNSITAGFDALITAFDFGGQNRQSNRALLTIPMLITPNEEEVGFIRF